MAPGGLRLSMRLKLQLTRSGWPTTPLTTLLLGEIAADVLPAGVFQTLVDANDLGPLLVSHSGVAHVNFTGSTSTGRKVLAGVASTLKRFTLELGGNDVAIVLDDVDVDEVAPKIYQSAMANAGQICLATKRVYAPAHLYDSLCDALGQLAAEAVVGDGMDPSTEMGPIQNQRQFDKLLGYLDEAKRLGTVVAGGHVLERDGYFIAPTIARNMPPNSALVSEEQFGPILPVLPYSSIEEAVAQL